MFTFLIFMSIIACFFSFCLMLSDFPTYCVYFFSTLISTWLFITLEKMSTKINDNEEEIKKLKQHFGIVDGSPVNTHNNIETDTIEEEIEVEEIEE